MFIYYSQTEQTHKAIHSLRKNFSTDVEITEFRIKPDESFPFPWKFTSFFRQFPKCICRRPPKLKPIPKEIFKKDYDLVVIGYQIWFLSPSLPTLALFENPEFSSFLKNKSVLGVITGRNMWISGVKTMNQLIIGCGASKIRNIALTDTSPEWATFITTPRWMLTGRKNAFWFFPEAGIPEKEYLILEEFGKTLDQNEYSLDGISTAQVSHKQSFAALLMEKTGICFFIPWANLIERLSPEDSLLRDLLLVGFRVNLILLILLLLPITGLFAAITRPLVATKLNGYYKGLLEAK